MKVKVCARCRETKNAKQFYGNRSSFDGLSDVCKTCNTLRVRESNRRRKIEKMSYEELKEFISDLKAHLGLACSFLNSKAEEPERK